MFRMLKSRAFWRGFLDGLAAPVLLFIPPPRPRLLRVKSDREALADDWRQVGNDMRRAMGLPEV